MKIILGLGNPGAKYELTRHNFGFLALRRLAAMEGFSDWKQEKKFAAEIASGEIGGEKVLLVCPQTFMNLSGQSARAVLDFYKLSPADVIAVYDELALPFSQIRLRPSGGAGGHNGVKNLIAHLGTQDFPRVRLGIANEFSDKKLAEKFVLEEFSAAEKAALPELTETAANSISEIVKNGLESAMNKFNQK